jgi:hypothetical protein
MSAFEIFIVAVARFGHFVVPRRTNCVLSITRSAKEMKGLWLLPTRRRLEKLAKFLRACND